MDYQKLVKLLALSTSDADGEALNAIRAANAILKKAGKTWDEVLKAPKGGTRADPLQGYWDEVKRHQAEKEREQAYWNNVVETCLHGVRGNARDFIESLADQWYAKGRLSQKQKDALLKFYGRL